MEPFPRTRRPRKSLDNDFFLKSGTALVDCFRMLAWVLKSLLSTAVQVGYAIDANDFDVGFGVSSMIGNEVVGTAGVVDMTV